MQAEAIPSRVDVIAKAVDIAAQSATIGDIQTR
jgi:hypothetical protein